MNAEVFTSNRDKALYFRYKLRRMSKVVAGGKDVAGAANTDVSAGMRTVDKSMNMPENANVRRKFRQKIGNLRRIA